MDKLKEDQFPDELFRSKLEGHEIAAGPGVWDRLSKSSKPVPVPLWQNKRLWAAAAISGVLLGCGFWLSPDLRRADLQDSGTVALKGVPVPPLQSARTEGLSYEGPAPVAELSGDGAKEKIQEESLNAGMKELPAAGRQQTESLPSDHKAMVANAGNGNLELAISKNSLEKDSGTAISESPVKVADGQTGTRVLVIYVTAPEQPVETVKETAYDSTVSLAVEEVTPEKKKKKGLQRLFRQLKNAKTGEKIDWDELGLNPQKVFANVDHTLEK